MTSKKPTQSRNNLLTNVTKRKNYVTANVKERPTPRLLCSASIYQSCVQRLYSRNVRDDDFRNDRPAFFKVVKRRGRARTKIVEKKVSSVLKINKPSGN